MRFFKPSILFLLAALCIGKVNAQQFNGINCSGDMPADLRKSMDQLYMEDRQRVKDYNNGKLSNRDNVLTSSYYISRLMASGRILYGDPISQMLEHIVDTLLTDYPDIRKELRIYTVKSSEVNAFTTGQGMIFVNLGLVAQVEDEAQLAFVLGHEIIHYVQKHNLEMLTRKHSKSDTTTQAGLNDFLRYHSRSREMEREADSLGIELFYAKSPYDKHVTDGFFDVLQYGYLPFDEVFFDTTQYNTPYFRFSSDAFLEKVDPISARDDYNDALSTHPNLLKRRLATTKQMAELQGGSRYVVTTEKEFDELRTLARMECIRQDLIMAEYASAYYNCYVMLRQQPDNQYLHLAKAQAIYGASKFRTYATASSTSEYRDKEGEIQQVYHMMRRAKPNELCIMAIREIWDEYRMLPEEPRLKAMVVDLIGDLHIKYKLNADNFSATIDTVANNDYTDTITQGNSKYSNVKRRRRQQQSQETFRYAFVDIMQKDAEFRTIFEGAIQQNERKKETRVSNKSTFLFTPSYYVFNDKTDDLKIKKSVNRENTFFDDLNDANTLSGISTVNFSDASMRSHHDAAFYNDFMRLNEWTNEFWQAKSKVPMIYSTQPAMNNLMQRYNADKLSLGLVINAENTKGIFNIQSPLLFIPFAVIAAPEVIYLAVTGHQATYVQNMLIDTRDGSTLSKGSNLVNSHDSRSLVRSQTYANMQKGLNPGKAPGYLGRHFIIEANGGLSFPILNHLFFYENTDALAFRYGGDAECVIGKHSSIAACIDFGNTPFDIENEPANTASIMTAGLFYHHYFNEHIAPLGPYIGGGFMVNKLKLSPVNTDESFHHIDDKQLIPAISLELGHHSILFDYIVLSFGVRYSITLANPIKKMDDYGGYFPDNNYTLVNPTRSLNANLWMYNLVSLHLSIGLIPF